MKSFLRHPAFLVFAPHAAYVPFSYAETFTLSVFPDLYSVFFVLGLVLWMFAWYLTISVTGTPKLSFGWVGSMWSGSRAAGEAISTIFPEGYRAFAALALALVLFGAPWYFAFVCVGDTVFLSTYSLPDQFRGTILNLLAVLFVVVTSGSVEKITGIKGGDSLADRIDRINAQAIEAKKRIDAIPGLDTEIKENMKMQIDVKREEDLKRALEGP